VTITHTNHTDHAGYVSDLSPTNHDTQPREIGQDHAAAPQDVPPAASAAGPELLLVDPRTLIVG